LGTCKPLSLLAAENLNDLYRFDPAALKWTKLSPAGPAPAPRFAMGFAATPDGMLYVFGGHGIHRYPIISYEFSNVGLLRMNKNVCLKCSILRQIETPKPRKKGTLWTKVIIIEL
jgi:hypothetical protein